MDKKLFNIFLLGTSFMFVFAAFQTMGNIEKIVLQSISQDDRTFTADGYVSLAIVYTVFSISNWLTPSLISILGAKKALIIGALSYVFFIGTFLMPTTWLVYVASAILGLGAAMIWNAQGHFLTVNSNPETISRNTAIFWTLLQLSMFFGNTFVFLKFNGLEKIDFETRTTIFKSLTGFAIIGVLVMLGLKNETQHSISTNSVNFEMVLRNAKQAFFEAFELFCSKKMFFISITSIYTGLELSFYSGVYGTCVGSTVSFGKDSNKLVGLSGVLVGVGEVLGGALFGFLGKKINCSKAKIFTFGTIVHLLAFAIIFLNLPNKSPLEKTTDSAILNESSAILAIFCSFLLGFGDSILNTQLIACLSNLYSSDSVSAFAILKFTQSLAAALFFFYSTFCGLYVQIVTLFLFAVFGLITFIFVNRTEKMNDEKL